MKSKLVLSISAILLFNFVLCGSVNSETDNIVGKQIQKGALLKQAEESEIKHQNRLGSEKGDVLK